MRTVFFDNGGTVSVSRQPDDNFKTALAPGVYEINYTPQNGYFLKHLTAFEIPRKIYGTVPNMAEKIIKTFNDRRNSTGVLLSGEKGSGKTLLTKLISTLCQKQGIPTLVVNQPYHGPDFNQFLQNIDQPAAVLFDEFEKVYSDQENKNGLLTLLDGVVNTRKLFLMTCNNVWAVDSHMKNRPGRLYYSISFGGVDETFINEYCNDNLRYHAWLKELISVTKRFSNFNFDMLQALVEEVNRYNESPKELISMLNVSPENEEQEVFNVTIFDEAGKKMNTKPVKEKSRGGFMRMLEDDADDEYMISFNYTNKEGKSDGAWVMLNAGNLVSFDEGVMVFDGVLTCDEFSTENKKVRIVMEKDRRKFHYSTNNIYGG